jgi:hypothetical protein
MNSIFLPDYADSSGLAMPVPGNKIQSEQCLEKSGRRRLSNMSTASVSPYFICVIHGTFDALHVTVKSRDGMTFKTRGTDGR